MWLLILLAITVFLFLKIKSKIDKANEAELKRKQVERELNRQLWLEDLKHNHPHFYVLIKEKLDENE